MATRLRISDEGKTGATVLLAAQPQNLLWGALIRVEGSIRTVRVVASLIIFLIGEWHRCKRAQA